LAAWVDGLSEFMADISLLSDVETFSYEMQRGAKGPTKAAGEWRHKLKEGWKQAHSKAVETHLENDEQADFVQVIGSMIAKTSDVVPEDAIIVNDLREFPSLLGKEDSPRGYALPAGVAARWVFKERAI
ncbi:hypothetical protein MHBO_005183, partial [Bonamia ostreae]